jgi:hypothetical protein
MKMIAHPYFQGSIKMGEDHYEFLTTLEERKPKRADFWSSPLGEHLPHLFFLKACFIVA